MSGSSGTGVVRCQVPGCPEELPTNTAYYKRYKICRYHSGLPWLELAGRSVRWCQQCTTFQDVSEFDGSKRSCRAALSLHNARRRKHSDDGASRRRKMRRTKPRDQTPSLALSEDAWMWDGCELEQDEVQLGPQDISALPLLTACGGAELLHLTLTDAEPAAATEAAPHAPEISLAAGLPGDSLLQLPPLPVASPAESFWSGLGLDLPDIQLSQLSSPRHSCISPPAAAAAAAVVEGVDDPTAAAAAGTAACEADSPPRSRRSAPAQPAVDPTPSIPATPASLHGAYSSARPGSGRLCDAEAQPPWAAPPLQQPQPSAPRAHSPMQQPALCRSPFVLAQAAPPAASPLVLPAGHCSAFAQHARASAAQRQPQPPQQQQAAAAGQQAGGSSGLLQQPPLAHPGSPAARAAGRAGSPVEQHLTEATSNPGLVTRDDKSSPPRPAARSSRRPRQSPDLAGGRSAAHTPATPAALAKLAPLPRTPPTALFPTPPPPGPAATPAAAPGMQLESLMAMGAELMSTAGASGSLPKPLMAKMQELGLALLGIVQQAKGGEPTLADAQASPADSLGVMHPLRSGGASGGLAPGGSKAAALSLPEPSSSGRLLGSSSCDLSAGSPSPRDSQGARVHSGDLPALVPGAARRGGRAQRPHAQGSPWQGKLRGILPGDISAADLQGHSTLDYAQEAELWALQGCLPLASESDRLQGANPASRLSASQLHFAGDAAAAAPSPSPRHPAGARAALPHAAVLPHLAAQAGRAPALHQGQDLHAMSLHQADLQPLHPSRQGGLTPQAAAGLPREQQPQLALQAQRLLGMVQQVAADILTVATSPEEGGQGGLLDLPAALPARQVSFDVQGSGGQLSYTRLSPAPSVVAASPRASCAQGLQGGTLLGPLPGSPPAAMFAPRSSGSGSMLTMVPVSGGLDVSRALPQLLPQRPAQQPQRARSPESFAAGQAVLGGGPLIEELALWSQQQSSQQRAPGRPNSRTQLALPADLQVCMETISSNMFNSSLDTLPPGLQEAVMHLATSQSGFEL